MSPQTSWIAPGLKAYEPGDENRIEPPDLVALEKSLSFLNFAERYHRYRVEGLENMPSGAALVASTHAFTVIDIFLLSKKVYEAQGRVIRGLTDHVIFKLPGIRDIFASCGILDGTQENGLAVLASGQLAGCMPGGGLEWSRSSFQKRILRWGHHKGYARLAVKAHVPVVPTCCPAADDCYWITNDGWALGSKVRKIFGLKRTYPIFGVVGLGPMPFPIQLTQYVEKPEWPASTGSEEERVDDLDRRVRAALERRLAAAREGS